MKLISFLLLLLFQQASFAEFEEVNRPFGHNLSHTDFYPKKSCSLGIQIAMCGLKKFGIGVSPFLITLYNSANIFLSKNIESDIEGRTHTVQLAYVKTFGEGDHIDPNAPSRRLNSSYQQESLLSYYIFSQNIRSNYRLHWNASFWYHFDDKQPFSLRRPTTEKQKYQINLSTLHEVYMTETFGLLGELGIMHAEAKYPRLHTGASLFYRLKHWYFQLGFTLTSTFDGLFVTGEQPLRYDYQQELRTRTSGYNGPFNKDRVKEDFSLHPEVSIQYFF